MEIQELRKTIEGRAKSRELDIEPPTSTVSWLYPGQFAYCLNEEFIWNKFGTFIDCPKEIKFHKIQPCIRWNDFEDFFMKPKQPSEDLVHLGHFDMTTITGGYIISKEKSQEMHTKSCRDLVYFLTEEVGLDKSRLKISYFPGGLLSEIGKSKEGKPKFDFEYKFQEDIESCEIFYSLGLKKDQIIPDKTRNCFLIPDWACGEVAPWGTRNEVYYTTAKGLVDIATLENLTLRPIYKEGNITSIEPWEKAFVINGTGLERLSMISRGLSRIQEVDNIRDLYKYTLSKNYSNPELICETIRLTHRIISDTNGEMSDSRGGKGRNRKDKLNRLLNILYQIDEKELGEMLVINSEINHWYSNFKSSKENVLNLIKEYKSKRKYISEQ